MAEGAGGSSPMDVVGRDGTPMDIEGTEGTEGTELRLDSYPYTFSPLLLFASDNYFEKGYSNHNAVAQFFNPCLPGINCCDNVMFEPKNMKYDDLLEEVTKKHMTVTCVIDDHSTAFQILPGRRCIYYDPMPSGTGGSELMLFEGDEYDKFVTFMLLKCKYGDNGHLNSDSSYYEQNALRKMIYEQWKTINKTSIRAAMFTLKPRIVAFDLNAWYLINSQNNFGRMSHQLTGNTCYFQTYLFVLLCKVCRPELSSRDKDKVVLFNVCPAPDTPPHTVTLRQATVAISRFLLTFFVVGGVIRPLTNSNILLDFYRFKNAAYYALIVKYFETCGETAPVYEEQYRSLVQYFQRTLFLHGYPTFAIDDVMSSSPNTKTLQEMRNVEDPNFKLFMYNYFKFRPANFMFGWNTNIMRHLKSAHQFNALRKNQLLAFYDQIADVVRQRYTGSNQYRDYYFMPQYEVGQPILRDLHNYIYELDLHAMMAATDGMQPDADLTRRIRAVNSILLAHIHMSTSRQADYHKFVDICTTEHEETFFSTFMSADWFAKYCGLGFTTAEKCDEVNAYSVTAFYDVDFMTGAARPKNILNGAYAYDIQGGDEEGSMDDIAQEAINSMAETLHKYKAVFGSKTKCDMKQQQKVEIRIGTGFTYTKYNTLMHFLNTVEAYWNNPDVSNIHVFGKDIRTLLTVSCQKMFFERGHTFYHYGCIERSDVVGYDLSVGTAAGVQPSVCKQGLAADATPTIIVNDRVYEYDYLRGVVHGMMQRVRRPMKTDDAVLNLALLSLLLDLGLIEEYGHALNLPELASLNHVQVDDGGAEVKGVHLKELQVEISNLISEFDKANTESSIKRSDVEQLICEVSHKFMVNKNFDIRSVEFGKINALNADPLYQRYLLLVKIYMSLCQVNQSTEVDYYKIKCDNQQRIIIPENFSPKTGDYLTAVAKRHNFNTRDGYIVYGDYQLFDATVPQPPIQLFRVRFESTKDKSSMVKYLEISNVFRASERVGGTADAARDVTMGDAPPTDGMAIGMTRTRSGRLIADDLMVNDRFIIFIADSTLLIKVGECGHMDITVNEIPIEVATVFINRAISFLPCFKYTGGNDVVLFTSENFHYKIDTGGQFNHQYYGMKHELMDHLKTLLNFVDIDDNHTATEKKFSELLKETRTVLFGPHFLLQVQGRDQLTNLLNYAAHIRNVPLFILVLMYLRRCSQMITYTAPSGREDPWVTGPWKHALDYIGVRANVQEHRTDSVSAAVAQRKYGDEHYNEIFEELFFNIDAFEEAPLDTLIDACAANFEKYQQVIDGKVSIVPRPKQKDFLKKIITSAECFHFSEVGSGKTKVILPLLCQIFLSNNKEATTAFARGGRNKGALVVLVPEHLVHDAVSQVFRYCLNLNFKQEYRIYDDIYSLMNFYVGPLGQYGKFMKQIFVTSFNQLKRALANDVISGELYPWKITSPHDHRDRMLLLIDEVDDFLDRDKLVFNLCSNKRNDFPQDVLDRYYETARATYNGATESPKFAGVDNPEYWEDFFAKARVIHNEVQQKSNSLNKSFGIFNEQTLRHSDNIAHDIEGYRSLIARPYESVNRAMPGSYYTDVERTIYLTYYILHEDTPKYDTLFQQERKFIEFPFYNEHPEWKADGLDFEDLVYGTTKFSVLVKEFPSAKEGLISYLYAIILRRMEVRDSSRSVSSLDVIFNFDCIGFTGTPFIDNYPTYSYLHRDNTGPIPDLINRSFYVYSRDNVPQDVFEQRFLDFQGVNKNVVCEYVPSEFIQTAVEEENILQQVFQREGTNFNVLVDLCGCFKTMTVFRVRDLLRKTFKGDDRFEYVYHISQTDGSDRVLAIDSDDDRQYDQEFYNFLVNKFKSNLRRKVFFLVDNRNVIGKDIPFQLPHRERFREPLFYRSCILAHDVEDFSKIWQAMGRSRTMNDTAFTIYKKDIPDNERACCQASSAGPMFDIKKHPLTRELYTKNCDRKAIGNLSSIYQTIISLFNLASKSFFHINTINNVFLDKMTEELGAKVDKHAATLIGQIFAEQCVAAKEIAGNGQGKFLPRVIAPPWDILTQLLRNKFARSSANNIAGVDLTPEFVQEIVRQVVRQKFENRPPTEDDWDDRIRFLSGQSLTLLEVSYTKNKNVQKQQMKQSTKDNDAMETFAPDQQIVIREEMPCYYNYTLNPPGDFIKSSLDMPIAVPIMHLVYSAEGQWKHIHVYPTLQFLYSTHIRPDYITEQVRQHLPQKGVLPVDHCARFNQEAEQIRKAGAGAPASSPQYECQLGHVLRFITDEPQYTMVALREGIYVIGMKSQFNIHDLQRHPLQSQVEYVADSLGHVLFAREDHATRVDRFGPYFVEQYLLMEVLTKHEVARNVLDYYRDVDRRAKLQACLTAYGEQGEPQGVGFVCWRFVVSQTQEERAALVRRRSGESDSQVGSPVVGAGGV